MIRCIFFKFQIKLNDAIFNALILSYYHQQRQNKKKHCQLPHINVRNVLARMSVYLKLIYCSYLCLIYYASKIKKSFGPENRERNEIGEIREIRKTFSLR